MLFYRQTGLQLLLFSVGRRPRPQVSPWAQGLQYYCVHDFLPSSDGRLGTRIGTCCDGSSPDYPHGPRELQGETVLVSMAC